MIVYNTQLLLQLLNCQLFFISLHNRYHRLDIDNYITGFEKKYMKTRNTAVLAISKNNFVCKINTKNNEVALPPHQNSLDSC